MMVAGKWLSQLFRVATVVLIGSFECDILDLPERKGDAIEFDICLSLRLINLLLTRAVRSLTQ